MNTHQIIQRAIERETTKWSDYSDIVGGTKAGSLREWLGMTIEEWGYYMIGDEYLLPILYSQENGCSIDYAVALLMDS